MAPRTGASAPHSRRGSWSRARATLLESVADLSTRERALVHTHASEQRDEIELVRQQTGAGNIEFLRKVGLLTPRLNVAHCVWVEPEERAMLAEHDAKVTHCPGSNLKLGSGIAPVPELLDQGVCVSLGSDGAACNNRLDMFGEMRLAATLQACASRARCAARPAGPLDGDAKRRARAWP